MEREACEQQDRLQLYYDGELEPKAAEEMRRHVTRCTVCAAELERLRALSGLFARYAAVQAPRDEERLPAQLARATNTQIGFRRAASRLLAAAAAILVTASGWLMLAPETRDRSDPARPPWQPATMLISEEPDTEAARDATTAQWILQQLSRGDRNG